jgi:CubicO group peptidase (beta-lactamase class C family)
VARVTGERAAGRGGIVTSRFDAVRALLEDAAASGASPAVTIEVGRMAGPVWRDAFGRLSTQADAPPARLDTVFDLASLTKVIVTTSVALRAVSDGLLDLDAPVAQHASDWTGADRQAVTLQHLLDHSSGLSPHADLWRDHEGRAAMEAAICRTPLAYPPGTASRYSDLGFLLAGFILERVTGRTLDAWLPLLVPAPSGEMLSYRPSAALRDRIAPTEQDPWRGRLLVGEVHDENAAAVGGVAAHAGTFGTVGAVGSFARLILQTMDRGSPLGSRDVMRRFRTNTGVPGSSRAIGWDTMLPTSSCGTRLSARAIGHTGFTGPSLWIDWERDLYVAILANRVHPTRSDERFSTLRPAIHDAIVDAL